MNFTTFPVATTTIFPISNSVAGGQLLTEWNLRTRDFVSSHPDIDYDSASSYVHDLLDYEVRVQQDDTGVILSNSTLEILPGTAEKGRWWQLLTGIAASKVNFGYSYLPIDPSHGGNGSYLGLRCAAHAAQQTELGGSLPSHYIAVGTSTFVNGKPWYAEGSVGITGPLEGGAAAAVRPERVRSPSAKIGVMEYQAERNVAGVGYLLDGRYLFNSSSSASVGPVHGRSAGVLFFDGHAGGMDVLTHFNAEGGTRGSDIWKQYFASNKN